MEKYYTIVFEYRNFENSVFRFIPKLKKRMESELFKMHNVYANMSNSGITDELNMEFKILYPHYFENNKGKDYWDLIEYNQFMQNGYNERIVKIINEDYPTSLMKYRVGDECQLIGMLRIDPKVEIEFYMKEA